jgi:hypothetical protein
VRLLIQLIAESWAGMLALTDKRKGQINNVK